MPLPPAFRRLCMAAVNTVLVLTVVAGLAWLGSSLAGFQRYVITGGSMAGTYDEGSVVVEHEVPVQDLRVGDVITYLPPASSGVHTLVTHRIVTAQRGPDGGMVLRTRGDANQDVDPWLFSLDAGSVPVVRYSIPVVGTALIALANPDTRRLLLGVPALAIALLAAADLMRAMRRTRHVAV